MRRALATAASIALLLPIPSLASLPQSYLEAPAVSAYDVDSTGFTVEFWVRVRSKPGFDPRMLHLVNADPGPCDYELSADVDVFVCSLSDRVPGSALAGLNAGGACHHALTTTRIDDGTYHHVAATYDGDSLRVYLDGVLNAAEVVPGKTIRFTGGRLVVGNSADHVSPFDGDIDELRLWKTARTEDEIRKFMNVEIDPCPAALVGYWRFNGDGQDLASSRNALVPHNQVVFREGKLGKAAHLLNHDSLRGSLEGSAPSAHPGLLASRYRP